MQEVRNTANRLICCIDKEQRIVQIEIKGIKTTIQFLENGTVKIINANKKM